MNYNLTPELKREGLMREVIRQVQNTRKAIGLEVDDRIVLSLNTDDKELEKAIDEHKKEIASETLATKFDNNLQGTVTEVKVDGVKLDILIEKA